jgi:haloalkane dehalogenase
MSISASRDATEQFVSTPAGRIFVREVPGEDPPIVLMHGFPDDHRIYADLLPQLSPRRAVAFDFLGYGRSDRPDQPGFSPEDHATQLTAVLDALGIARSVLVGHDASGPDTVFYAVARPERVAGVVLLNTIFGRQKSLTMPEMTRLFSEPELTALADDMMDDVSQRLWVTARWGAQMDLDPADPDGIASRSIIPQFFGSDGHPDAIRAIRAWTAGLPASFDRQDALAASGVLRSLQPPVTLIFGETDRYLNPSLAAELVQLFTAPTLHLIPRAGHYPQHDQPQTVASLITQFA